MKQVNSISILVPLFNEAEVLQALITRLDAIIANSNMHLDVVLV
jgi:glycosyltransferase involved in cell wall biosynthesis